MVKYFGVISFLFGDDSWYILCFHAITIQSNTPERPFCSGEKAPGKALRPLWDSKTQTNENPLKRFAATLISIMETLGYIVPC